METIGSRDKQKIVLTTNLSKDRKYSTESESYAVPVPSLEFASLCLRNAFLLLPSGTASQPAPLFVMPGITQPVLPPSPGPAPSNPLKAECIVDLKNHILVTSAYVALCLGDYIIALEHANTLLEQPSLSNGHKLLAHLYAAESLILSDKITEALEHLKPDIVKDIAFNLPAEKGGKNEEKIKTNPPQSNIIHILFELCCFNWVFIAEWFPNTLTSAQAVLQYNIAVAKTIRGQLDQAGILLKQIWQQKSPTSKVPAHIIMLVIYIELQLGMSINFYYKQC